MRPEDPSKEYAKFWHQLSCLDDYMLWIFKDDHELYSTHHFYGEVYEICQSIYPPYA